MKHFDLQTIQHNSAECLHLLLGGEQACIRKGSVFRLVRMGTMQIHRLNINIGLFGVRLNKLLV